jgi:hypothetical protein
MPNGTIGLDLDERSAFSEANAPLLSRPGLKNVLPESTQSDHDAVASLLGLYLAHELKLSLMGGRIPSLSVSTLPERSNAFDRATLNKLIETAHNLRNEQVISNEQYASVLTTAATMYVEHLVSLKYGGYLETITNYISKAFRDCPI